MKYLTRWSLAVMVALVVAALAVLAAQEPQNPQNPQDPTSGRGTKVTVTGCLEQATPAKPTGTSGDVETVAPDTKFVLTKPGVQGTSGTSDSGPNVIYRLDDPDGAKLTGHEGQKVEITGTVTEEAQPPEAGEMQEDRPSSAATQSRPPKLTVETVKMIAWSCTQ
jgi:hypothetical protein